MLFKAYRGVLLVGACAAAFSGAALAQDAATMVKIAGFGGAMHAAAEHCGDYTAAQLEKLKTEQRTSLSGLSDADFDAAFNGSREQARKNIATATPEQRAEMCKTLRAQPKP